MKKWVVVVVVILVFGLALIILPRGQRYFFRPRVVPTPTPSTTTNNPSIPPGISELSDREILATGLTIPWEIEFLPNGDLLVTERSGSLVRIDGQTKSRTEVKGVRHVGEGGLLGMVLDPDFDTNNYLYLYLTSLTGGSLENRLERYIFANDQLIDRVVILDNIPGAPNHDGGKIEFGPDGMLYVTTGDAQSPDLAQDTESLAGKILRIKPDGSIPDDNPYGNEIWSYGHRNPQGLAWDTQRRLWSSEHGPSGSETGNDEINLIKIGNNYGWPEIRGTQEQPGMISPVIESGGNDTWAPGAIAILGDKLYFTGLRGETLYSARIQGDKLSNFKRHLFGEYGRLRALKIGSEGYLYLSTSNTDGRGDTKDDDDKIIRINPASLE